MCQKRQNLCGRPQRSSGRTNMKGRCRAPMVRMLVIVAVMALSVTPALAVHNDGIFQLDGDAFKATCGTAFGAGVGCTGDDWNQLYSCSTSQGNCDARPACDLAGNGTNNNPDPACAGNANANHANVISDFVFDPAPMSIFTGGGSKDESDIVDWQWVNGSVPDKD